MVQHPTPEEAILTAAAYLQAGRLEEALELAREAVRLAPGDAEAHNMLGQVLQALGEFEHAIEAYRHAAALPGAGAEHARVNHAVLLMEKGLIPEAAAAFDSVLADYPRSVTAWTNRADLKKFAPGDPDIEVMKALLNSGPHPQKDRLALHFALGKALLDAGEDREAFEHFHAGNRLKRATLTFDVEATAAWMGRIAETFSEDLFKTLDKAGHPSARPIFVVGMPRSGTTLVEQILSSHPAVAAGGELSALQEMADAIPHYPVDVGRFEPVYFTRLGSAYGLQTGPLAERRRHLTDKMPANFLHLGLIRLILPNARIIHCRRDPVDTCLSCYTKLFTAEQAFTYDLAELGRFHLAYQALMAHWRAVLPAQNFIEIDYEALVADVETETHRLLDRLGLPWDPACLRFFENAHPVTTASVNQVRQPVYQGSAGRWRRYAAHLEPLLKSLAGSVSEP